jgi:hypothetical protein
VETNVVKSETLIEKQACPYCGALVDCVGEVYQEKIVPRPGSAVICIKCANIQVIQEDRTLTKATKKDLKRFKKDKEAWKIVQKVQAAVRRMRQVN